MADPVKADVLQTYLQYPYPRYSAAELERIKPAELCRYRYLGIEHVMRGARVLDVGCGTAHRVMPMAKHFGAAAYFGLEQSAASIAVARELAEQIGMNAVIVEGDLFSLPFPDSSFDVVISQGVLHHTSDPWRGFAELVRVCKRGGFVEIYLYNWWNHLRHNRQKARVDRQAGADLHQRLRVAHQLYGTKPLEEMTASEVAGFVDQYCHPHKSDHTVEETLARFDESGLEYWGSYPPLRFRDFAGMVQYRSSLSSHYARRSSRIVSRLLTALPAMGRTVPPFSRPSAAHSLLFQMAYAIQGAGGSYSGGPAFCGRKG